MRCERIEELLSAFLEGELSPAEKALVEGHLADCPDCASLLGDMRRAQQALTGFPEVEVSPGLQARLAAIPEQKKKFSFTFDFVLKPALQPVFAAAAIFMTLLSFYLFNPDKKAIDRTIDQKIHTGYSQVEKLYARAGSYTDRLGDTANNILGSVKNWKVFGGNEDDPYNQ
ncbi:MAG: zf-HC2 domain-containing protein [Candidatus Aminicenantales bacterium]